MKNLLNPKWIFIINTLPIILLFSIYFGEYQIIKSLLTDESTTYWLSFGIGLGSLGSLNFVYGLFLVVRRRKVSHIYAFAALVSYMAFIYLYGYHLDKIIPFSIPQWMIPNNLELYAGTFLMPTLIYALFILVDYFTPNYKSNNAWNNFVICVFIPIGWYAFFQLVLPLWQTIDHEFIGHITVVTFIIVTIGFLFFLIRAVYIFTQKKNIAVKESIIIKIVISLILPIIGLLLNNIKLTGIFGDFSNQWFYIIAVLNSILICAPSIAVPSYRLLLFIGRALTFSYTLYFFLVFLPFFPLSILAILVIGTGFLMLTPLALFVIHINVLSKDFVYLRNYIPPFAIITPSFIAFLTIPFFIHLTYLDDKENLYSALDYLYSPDYSQSYTIDRESLKRTINIVEEHKEKTREVIFRKQQPYLSTYFNWLVMDNLTLSDAKLNKINAVFFNETIYKVRPERIRDDSVSISNISSKSEFDKEQNAWKSWVDLEITNASTRRNFQEYATTIELPKGTWISDYYLYVGDRKEAGILAEKRSAMWVFSNIRNENRDPGILYYLNGNKVAFRVFPFAKEEVRTTGIELLHREPIQLNIDGNKIALGSKEIEQEVDFENDEMVYISAETKEKLKKIERAPYFHLVVDVSNEYDITSFIERIETLLKSNKALAKNAKITYTNSYIKTELLGNTWQENIKLQQHKGGFYADRAIKSILFNSYKEPSETYPIIVLVTDNIEQAVFDKNYLDWEFTYPESNIFYSLNSDNELKAYSLKAKPNQLIENIDFELPEKNVLEYKDSNGLVHYLSDNKKASILYKTDKIDLSKIEIKEKSWSSAIAMHGSWVSQLLHPENTDKQWLNLVKYSFVSKVMSPVTSYIALENEAQKAALLRKQEQVLSGKRVLDLQDDAERMSEPSNIILITLLIAFLIFSREKLKSFKRDFKLR